MFKNAGENLPQRLLGLLGSAQGFDQPDSLRNLPKGQYGTDRGALPNFDVLIDVSQFLEVCLVFQRQFHGLDLLLGGMGEVGQSPVQDPSILAIGFAEQVPGVLTAVDGVGAGVDVHSGHIIGNNIPLFKHTYPIFDK